MKSEITPQQRLAQGVRGGLCLLLLLGLVVFLRAPSQRDAEYQAAQKAGVPLTVEALLPPTPISAEDNAGPLVRQLIARKEALSPAWLSAAKRVTKNPQSTSDVRAFREGLPQHQALLDLYTAATERPRCDIGFNYKLGVELDQSALTVFSKGATLFVARALLSPDADEAFADIERAVRLGNLAAQTPLLMAAVVSSSVHRQARDGHSQLVARFGVSPASQRALLAFAKPPTPEFFFSGEAALSFTAAQQLRRTPERFKDLFLRRLAPVYLPLWERQLVRFWSEVYATLRRYPADSPELLSQLAALEDKWYGRKKDASVLAPFKALKHVPDTLVIYLAPPLRSAVEKTQDLS